MTLFNSRKVLNSAVTRCFATKNGEISAVLTNRNPRNLEKLRIGYKPDGYHVDKPGRSFWHKLELGESGRHVTASVVHYKNGEVLYASSNEWAIKKQLYKTTDAAAYMNVGRVLAQRCLESGILELRCDVESPNEDGKIALLLKAMTENGVSLQEPPQFKSAKPWDLERPEKPWEVTE